MNKDQKQLENLYEEIESNKEFRLIEQENNLFEKIASMITKEIFQALIKPGGDINYYSVIQSLSVKLNPNETVSRYVPNEIKEEASMVYFVGIIYYLTKNKIFLKRYYEPEDDLFFEFETTDRLLNVKRKVRIQDKEKFQQSLKEWFAKQLEHLYPSFEHEYPNWAKWRREQIKFGCMKNKLPELNGIF